MMLQGGNGRKWKEMEGNGRKWKEMEGNGRKWKELLMGGTGKHLPVALSTSL